MIAQAIFAAGCFWGVQLAFDNTPGVVSTEAGYVGGSVENPSYRQVSTGQTGHAEAVEVSFDTDKISYPELLDIFFKIHNPKSPRAGHRHSIPLRHFLPDSGTKTTSRSQNCRTGKAENLPCPRCHRNSSGRNLLAVRRISSKIPAKTGKNILREIKHDRRRMEEKTNA